MKHQTRKTITFLVGLITGAFAVSLIAFRDPDDKDKMVNVSPEGRLMYKWYPPQLPTSIAFAGEAAPVDRWDVRERLDRDILMNYYLHGTLLYILKLSTRYFPMIEARLKANGIPDDFKYLCVAESSLQHLTSSAGAQSFWQFLSATGSHYGLRIDAEVDERYDIPKATDAACQYFLEAKTKFGTWTAAAASYNCGMGGYNSAATYQHTYNYYDLLLPEETNRYIFRILALKYLMSNAAAMGYIVQGEDAYKPINTRIVYVSQSIPDLAQFAISNGTTFKILRLLNPWLRGRTLTVRGGKVYSVSLPA